MRNYVTAAPGELCDRRQVAVILNPETDDLFWVDANQRPVASVAWLRCCLNRLPMPTNFYAPHTPRIGRGEVIDDERHSTVVVHIPELLAVGHVDPGNVEATGLRVEGVTDRAHLQPGSCLHSGHSAQRLRKQVRDFCVSEYEQLPRWNGQNEPVATSSLTQSGSRALLRRHARVRDSEFRLQHSGRSSAMRSCRARRRDVRRRHRIPSHAQPHEFWFRAGTGAGIQRPFREASWAAAAVRSVAVMRGVDR